MLKFSNKTCMLSLVWYINQAVFQVANVTTLMELHAHDCLCIAKACIAKYLQTKREILQSSVPNNVSSHMHQHTCMYVHTVRYINDGQD